VIDVSGQLSIDDALALVLERVAPLEAEDVPVGLAAGRVLAAPASATIDLPPFDSSAMDGFAVRPEDTPGRLRVIGQSAAGRPFDGTLAAGEAVGISTGAVVPSGAGAIVPVEEARLDGDSVVVEKTAPAAHVRVRGGDAAAGSLVVPAGARLFQLALQCSTVTASASPDTSCTSPGRPATARASPASTCAMYAATPGVACTCASVIRPPPRCVARRSIRRAG